MAPSLAKEDNLSSRHSPRLLDQVRAAIRVRHYSLRTEQTYVYWIKRFIVFHGKRHPKDMGHNEIGQFLSALAVEQKVSAVTQNQALNALVFLYRHVLDLPPGIIENIVRAKRPQRLPVVLKTRSQGSTRQTGGRILAHGALAVRRWAPLDGVP